MTPYDFNNPYSAANSMLYGNTQYAPNDYTVNVTGTADPTGSQSAAPISDGTTQAPTSGPWAPQGSNGGSPLDSILQAGLNLMPGSSGSNMGLTMLPAAMASAYKQWQDAGKYMGVAREAAGISNPYGPYRQAAATNLTNLETDPNKYLASAPDYQAALQQGLDQTDRINAARGLGASGKSSSDQIKYASQLAAQYLNQDRQALMQEAGVGFNPANAGQMLMTGQANAINSQNAALASMFAPFTMNAAANRLNSQGLVPGGGGSGASVTGPALAALSRLNGNTVNGGGGSIDMNGFNTNGSNGFNVDPTTGDISFTGGPTFDGTNWQDFGGNTPIDTSGGIDTSYNQDWMNTGGGFDTSAFDPTTIDQYFPS